MTRAASLVIHDYEPTTATFLDDVLNGFAHPAKRLPCKYLYDLRGCRLFEAICELEEYYLTRTELHIMQRFAAEMAALIGPQVAIVELGSGSSTKTRALLDRLTRPLAYVPVDIARDHLMATAAQLRLRYPHLEVAPLCADFSDWFELPDCVNDALRRVAYFPGSTLGNLEPNEVEMLLARLEALVGDEGGLLIGIDLKKDRRTLEAAYNDRRGLTARFNLNLLARINRELEANFQLDRFHHSAIYNETAGRIEMHLISRCRQTAAIHGHPVHFRRGEPICTEYSYKFDLPEFRGQAARAGFQHVQTWTDLQDRFAVIYFSTSEHHRS